MKTYPALSPCRTHHLLDGKSFYPQRFIEVLAFQPPEVAAVLDLTGAYHITLTGEPLYSARFQRTFGFYENKASVVLHGQWFHIHLDGSRVYQKNYAWCGNFQEGACSVRDEQQQYFHINASGLPLYKEIYQYVGDFYEGFATVQRADGLHSHINTHGKLLHGRWFQDLDVFHKGYARAQDGKGWCHINLQGQAIYQQRYRMIEPFYNGQARVETFAGALQIIDERGIVSVSLRAPLISPVHQASGQIVGFWQTQTIYAAVKLSLFLHLPNSLNNLANLTKIPISALERLLRALWELNLVEPVTTQWCLTETGQLFTQTSGIAEATEVWAVKHYQQWMQLPDCLRGITQAPDFFQQMSDEQAHVYHQAIQLYAEEDYQAVNQLIDWQSHQRVIDAGGSYGCLLFSLLKQYRHLSGVLLDLPQVIQKVVIPKNLTGRCELYTGDLFANWSVQADAVILARVLHDWEDTQALRILTQAKQALTKEGHLYIIEMLLSDTTPVGSLLDLNMLVMTNGRERTLAHWQTLFSSSGFKLLRCISMSNIANILVLSKI